MLGPTPNQPLGGGTHATLDRMRRGRWLVIKNLGKLRKSKMTSMFGDDPQLFNSGKSIKIG